MEDCLLDGFHSDTGFRLTMLHDERDGMKRALRYSTANVFKIKDVFCIITTN